LAVYETFVGTELAVSYWKYIDQTQVNQFGEASWHTHWMHTDPKRTEAEGPYGGTLAHRFLMLSFLSNFMDICNLRLSDSTFALNYGVDKVRFLASVIVGDGFRIRDHIKLLEVERRPKGLFTRTTHELEIKGTEGIVLYAKYLTLWIPEGQENAVA
jgi:acyl dehydratase